MAFTSWNQTGEQRYAQPVGKAWRLLFLGERAGGAGLHAAQATFAVAVVHTHQLTLELAALFAVNAGFFAIGLWLRDLVVLLASSTAGHGAVADLLLWSTLKALTTAVAGVMVLVIFRRWLSIRLAE